MAFQRFRPLTHLPQLPAFVTYRRLYQVDHCRAHLSDADSVSLPARFTSPDLDTFDLIALPHIDVATALQTRPVTVTHPIVSLYLCFVSPCRFACPLSLACCSSVRHVPTFMRTAISEFAGNPAYQDYCNCRIALNPKRSFHGLD